MTRVYKFLPKEWALDDIEKRRIKISRVCDLNDPFDLSPFDLSDGDQRDALIRARKELFDRGRGLLCFSFKWSNPLLWAHYADKHKGICLGFDLPVIRHVAYVSTRLPFPILSEVNEQTGLDWLFTKFSSWCHEAECRVFAKLDPEEEDENGNYHVDFKESQMTLREVILGCECQLDPTGVLESLLEPYKEEVRVIRARPSDESFDMIEDTVCFRRL